MIAGGFKRTDHLPNAVTFAGAQVPGRYAGFALNGIQGLEMPVGEVYHMDVVAHAGAIGRGVIIAKDRQGLALASGNLADVRQQVVGHAVGVFTDQAAGVRAHRVEVTQQGNGPARVRGRQVSQ